MNLIDRFRSLPEADRIVPNEMYEWQIALDRIASLERQLEGARKSERTRRERAQRYLKSGWNEHDLLQVGLDDASAECYAEAPREYSEGFSE